MPQLAFRTNPSTERLGLSRAANGYGYVLDQGLQTLEINTLYTRRRGEDAGGKMRNGYWANPRLGTLLWTLYGQPIVKDTAIKARQFIVEGFAWTIEAGLFSRVDVIAERPRGQNYILIGISPTPADPLLEPWSNRYEFTTENLVRIP